MIGWTVGLGQDPELTFLPLSASELSKQACGAPRGTTIVSQPVLLANL